MADQQPPCVTPLGMHSTIPWLWKGSYYWRDCIIYGCNFSETAKALTATGQRSLVNDAGNCAHNWGLWRTTAIHDLFEPPYLYQRDCLNCGAKELVEELKRAV